MSSYQKFAAMLGVIVMMSACAVAEPGPTPMTPSPTASFTASLTITPSITPTITQTPTPATPVAIMMRKLQLRSGPGDGFSTVGLIAKNYPVTIYGISPDGQWALLGQPGQLFGWLALSAFVTVSGDVQSIPVVTVSPTPPTPPAALPLSSMEVRSGPGNEYPVVAHINGAVADKTTYAVLEASMDGGWYRISLLDGQTGWIPASSLVEITGAKEFVPVYVPTNPPSPTIPIIKIVAAVGARIVPDERAAYIDFLEVGEELEMVARSSDGTWYGVQLPNSVGWIPASPSIQVFGAMQFVATYIPSPTPSPTATVTPTPIPTVDVDAIAATVEAAVMATLSAQGMTPAP
jgi:uncharacterized protein YraI